MALNLTTIKKSGITTLTLKKDAQVVPAGRSHFLANQPKPGYGGWATIPPTTDASLILPAGTTLQVLGVYPGGTKYGPGHVEVHSSTGRTFDIMAPDIGRFTM